ncbi:MAG: hypothetical protein P4L81_03690 [Candidatus Pacebacteria bacterium]|nr:hypothetical protein [Candidatus Paceibacterota bacterium]
MHNLLKAAQKKCFLLSIVGCLVLLSPVSYAEQCWQMDTCHNLVGLFRINKDGQVHDAIKAMFGSEELPSPGTIVVIRRSANLRLSFNSSFDDRNLRLDDPVDFGGNEGQFMAAGTKVEILGYQVGQHLFAVVRIVEFSYEPYKDEQRFTFDPRQVI